MSVYKRKFRNAKGKIVRAATYTAEFRHAKKLHRLGGFINREIAEQWLRAEQVRLQRGELKLIKPVMAAPVDKLIEEFVARLESLRRDEMYVYSVGQRLKRLANDCGWLVLGNITATSMQAWIASKPKWYKRTLTAGTINQYIDVAHDFGNWLVKPRQAIAANPLADVERVSTQPNTFYRRAATVDEIQRLISHAPADRRLFYTFLLYSPLRMKAIRGLLWDDLRLDAERPCVHVRSAIDKARSGQNLPLRMDVAHMLRIAKKKAKASGSDHVFDVRRKLNNLQADLKAAGIPFSDEKGNHRLDRHAFRRTLIGLLQSAGVQLDVAHLALGHKDKRTTEKWYSNNLANAPITNAMESIPAIKPLRIAGGRK